MNNHSPPQRKYRPSARSIASEIFTQAFYHHVPLDKAFDQSQRLNTLEARDRAFCRAMVQATMRHVGWLLLALKAQLKKPLPKNAQAFEAILLIGLAQKLIMNVPIHAVVNETVNLAKQSNKTAFLAGLANAVLRKAEWTNSSELENWPEWLMQGWVNAYGEAAAIEAANICMNEPPLDISVVSSPETWAERLGGTLLPTGTIRLIHGGRIDQLDGFSEGQWWVQDVAASFPVLMMGNVAGQRVLDLCAAPGGKTAQLIAAGAQVTAVDKDAHRMKKLQENLARMQMKAECHVADATRFGSGQFYDCIILDAPCSATGTLRKRPDVAWNRMPQDIQALTEIQRNLLNHAFTLLKPGGYMVYATCSLEPAEGEDQLTVFLQQHQNARILTDWVSGPMAEFATPQGYLRTLPHFWAEQGGMDGFFAAKISKI